MHFAGYQEGPAFVRWLQALDEVWILGLGNDWSGRAAAQARACGVRVVAVREGALERLADAVVERLDRRTTWSGPRVKSTQARARRIDNRGIARGRPRALRLGRSPDVSDWLERVWYPASAERPVQRLLRSPLLLPMAGFAGAGALRRSLYRRGVLATRRTRHIP